MKKVLFLLIILAAGVIQTTVLKGFRVFNISPDLLLVAMVFASFTFKPAWAIGSSIFAGFIKDLFCIGTFNMFFFGVSSFLITELTKKVSLENAFLRSGLVLFVALLGSIAARLVFLYLGVSISPWVSVKIIILDSLYTAMVALLVFKAIRPAVSENL